MTLVKDANSKEISQSYDLLMKYYIDFAEKENTTFTKHYSY